MAQQKIVIAFDLYGTLLSTESISKRLTELSGSDEKGTQVAALWRKYQLEYTWRLTCMGCYDDFFNITHNALRHALSEAAVSLGEEKIQHLMEEYDHLSTFPDVAPALENLRKRADVKPVIFSNGTKQMVSNSVSRSQNLAPHAALFADLITVESVKKFKPAPEVYEHLATSTNTDKGSIWLVTANPFDVVGATKCGVKAAWLDRNGRGWEDAAAPELRPRVIERNLEDLLKTILDSSVDK